MGRLVVEVLWETMLLTIAPRMVVVVVECATNETICSNFLRFAAEFKDPSAFLLEANCTSRWGTSAWRRSEREASLWLSRLVEATVCSRKGWTGFASLPGLDTGTRGQLKPTIISGFCSAGATSST